MLRASDRRGVAVVAVTPGGARLGGEIAAALGERATLHVAARWLAEAPAGAVPIDEPLAERVGRLFREAEALLLLLAAGAAIRLVAPHLGAKQDDPAVLVVDEAGRHVVPLLGGHQADANALAVEIADAIGATAVVTTASDILDRPALDTLGRAAGWRLESAPDAVRQVSALMVAGAALAVYQDAGDPAILNDLPPEWPRLDSSEALAEWRGPALIVSDRVLAEPARPRAGPWVVYRPPTLVLGVGSSLGAPPNEIAALARAAVDGAGLAWGCVSIVATIDRRLDEPGIVALAERLGARLVGYSADELAAVADVPSPSSEVARHVGTPSVAEAAALLASDGGTLVATKVRSAHATAAVARHAPERRRGHLALVGLGPGPLDLMTGRARRALRAADVVIGYRGYLDQLRGVVAERRLHGYNLGQERERAAEAIAQAESGRRIALASSGDVGIYGMAGLVFELLAERAGGLDALGFDVEVIPGVTAASAAGALLGAPLMLDFAAISLSDLLVPWDNVRRRLDAALAGDLVLVLYNPASAARRARFAEALAAIRSKRPPDTPVGAVREAYRPEQHVEITTLGALSEDAVDMKTVLIVGCSRTTTVGPWLVTRRGYLDRVSDRTAQAGPSAETPSETA